MPRPSEHIIGRPSGGVNTRTYATELTDDEFVMLKNIDPFTSIGAFVARKGTTAWNTTLPVASKPVRGGFRFYFGTSSVHLLMVAGTDVWYKSGAAGNFTSAVSGVTEDRDWSFASYLDICYLANGVDAMRRWDGTTMRSAGFPAPGTAPTVAAGAAGGLTGGYKYKVTFVYDSNAAHESSASPATDTVSPSAALISLTSIPLGSGGSGVTSRRIYRTRAGGSIYYYLTTINDNTTTTYTDNHTAATGSITTVAGANLVDGETFTLYDGVNVAKVFEFDSSGAVTAGRVAVTFTGASTADQVRDAIISAVNGASNLDITAASGGAGLVNLTADTKGTAANQTITETVANAGFVVSGMSGGTTGNDDSLGTDQAPTDNGVPPAAQFVLFWRGRMVAARTAAQPQRVCFSSITSTEKSPGGTSTVHGLGVEIFPATHYIDVGDDNSPITGMAILQDQLVVFKEDQIWNISGDEALDFRMWRSQSSVGCIAPKTIVNLKGTLLFLGRNEGVPAVYSYDGSSSDEISLPVEPTLSANIYALGDTTTQPIQPCACRYRGCYILAYRKTGGTTYECAVLDTKPPRARWMFFSGIEASVFIPFNGRSDSGEMYYGHRGEARVLRLDNKLTEYDATTPTAVSGTIETGWLDLGAPYHLKQINWIDIYGKEGDQPSGCDPDPGDTTITFERRYDFAGSGSNLGCNAVNVSTASKHMSRSLWKHRIHCEASEGATPELCYRTKFVITTSAPIEIHRIVVNFTPYTPEDTHGQN